MARVNLDGTAPGGERVTLEDKARFPASFVDVRIQEVKDYETSDTVNKLIVVWNVKAGKEEHEIPMWINPIVSKGSGTFSNSKLYDAIEVIGLMDDFRVFAKDRDTLEDEELRSWVEGAFTGVKAEVEIKNRNKGTDDEYSNVSEIIKKK